MKYQLYFFMLMAFMVAGNSGFSQCRTYLLNAQHDTINCTDFQNRKQGFWDSTNKNNHGEPGYRETGSYKNNQKEGRFIRRNLMGDTIADEHYKWGCKDGLCYYSTLLGLEHVESWKAIDPANPYDTIKVYDLNVPDKYEYKQIRIDATTVKQGTWTYYNPERGTIIKTEDYALDKLVTPKSALAQLNDSLNTTGKYKYDSLASKKPPEVLEYEKKNAKKRIKVRDGATGVN